MSKFWPALIALQLLGCLMIVMVFGSEISSTTRNPEAGLAAVLFGFPLVIGEVIGLGLLYLCRAALPDAHREKILLASTALMFAAPLVLLLAMQGT